MEPEKRKRKSRFFPGLIVGLILGWLGSSLAPTSWQSYIPDALRPGGLVDGEVLEKSKQSDRLLLKLTTERGMILATFTERQEEINLLVEPGDTVTLRVERYEPFVEDPPIVRVRRPDEPVTPSLAPELSEPNTAPSPDSVPEPAPVLEDEAPPDPSPATTSVP